MDLIVNLWSSAKKLSGGRSDAVDQEPEPTSDSIEVFASSIEAAAKRIQDASSAAAKAPVRVLVWLVKDGPSEQEGFQMSEALAAALHAPPAAIELPQDAQVQDLRAAIAMRSRGTLYVAAIKRRSCMEQANTFPRVQSTPLAVPE
uniref:Uncharacterized protein n=1 Tax=Dunaliella tertiolecta TaxID=3047 RepID=A0A7S3QRS3_DUNTE